MLWWVPARAGLTRADAAVAAGFVLAALGEAVVVWSGTPRLLVFQACGAPLLAVVALRRTRPVLSLAVIAAGATLGTAVQTRLWPDTGDGGGVWLFALMFAAYSVGAHGRGRLVLLGGVLPLLAGLLINLATMTGWALVNGVLFLTTFVGVLPTAVGRLVRVRRARLVDLEEQADRIVREQRSQREAAVLLERLRITERLRPALMDGLRDLADRAEGGADPGEIEESARRLLGRTRAEVVALTAPVDVPEPIDPPRADHVQALRAASQRWAVLGAGVLGAGLALESTGTLPLSAPAWVAVLASVSVSLPLAFVWWRPLPAVAVAWCAATVFSRLVAPLDGSLSGAALALSVAFAVGALCNRRQAVVGLALCWVGQLLGVMDEDRFGVAVIIVVSWLGGLAVNEASRLVEQGRANNRVSVHQESAAQHGAMTEERLRLAREVHDQIGHSLTVVALQAAGARRLAATAPDRAQEAMATIAGAARDGLAALSGQGAADLAAVLHRTRAAGLSLTADVAGLDAPGLIDPESRAAVCRIVQEALTNVLRHAPGAAATVVAGAEGDGVGVTIRNGPPTGPGGAGGSGRGLAGLRQRVAARGGEVCWGPLDDGGFEVRAVLPAHRMEDASR